MESEWVERFGAERVDQLRAMLLELVAPAPALATAA
jgi:hypothetical protein